MEVHCGMEMLHCCVASNVEILDGNVGNQGNTDTQRFRGFIKTGTFIGKAGEGGRVSCHVESRSILLIEGSASWELTQTSIQGQKVTD